MRHHESIQLVIFFIILMATTPLLGAFMARVFNGEKHFLSSVLGWLERLIYRVAGVHSKEAMSWKVYAGNLICFNLMGIAFLFILQMIQGYLPLSAHKLTPMTWHSALNTAVSFVTNTNWQAYSGESTMTNLTQMLGLAVQNFLSAATGIVVAIAFARGVVKKSTNNIGNLWGDLTRCIVYVLLPLSFVFALLLVSQGVVQTFSSAATVKTLEGLPQVLPLGPVASQVAIKMIGTNGGGFFNANSAHPFENPTPLSNFLEMFAIFLIPAALTFTFGKMVRSQKHGWILFGSMFTLFVSVLVVALYSEYSTNPFLGVAGVMEGKETRFGVFNSTFFAMLTTAASCGAVNAMHASLSPLSGGMAMLNILLGEVVFGGVGAGFYGMMLFVLMTVFMAGLMVGRTPEYLGKKIEAQEMKWVLLAILIPSACILIGTGISVISPAGLSGLGNTGPHGFTEILYAFSSAAGNNGSAFAGLNANTPYYNLMLAVAMLAGRFGVIIPILAVAGSLAAKKHSPASSGTFEVDSPLFALLLCGVIVIVGGLTFLPALSLGPLVEHLLMLNGNGF